MITTVLGDIEPGALGFCQSHEHLSIRGDALPPGAPGGAIDDPEKSGQELALYHNAGGSAVVDAQPPGCGRDALMLASISRGSGVHVIASTGFHRMLYYAGDHWIHRFGEDRIRSIFITELTEGMYIHCDRNSPEERCGSRAGQIKAALEPGAWDAQGQKLFNAAAGAAVETGRALMVHIERGSDPLALADFLLKVRADLRHTIFCHLDRSVEDLGIHRELCERGLSLEYDTIARYKYHGDDKETGIILAMLEAGWEKQLLLSLDLTRARLRCYGGEPGLPYILETFIPLLRRRGVSEGQIRLFFHENPRRLFNH
jgi:phosphotriesterase-related protein